MDDAGIQEKLDNLKGELSGDFERLNQAQDDWIERLGDVRGLLRSLAGALEKHKSESTSSQEKLLSDLSCLGELLSGGGADAEALQSRIAELESELAESNSAAEVQAHRLSELEEELSARAKSLEAAVLEASELKQLQQEAAELREAERALKNELASLRPLAEQATESKGALEAELEDLRTKLQAAEAEVAEAAGAKADAEGRLAELESSETDAASKLQDAEDRANAADKECASLRSKLDEALQQAEQAEAEIAQARESHEQALAAQEEFGQQLAQLQKQLDAEHAKVASYEELLEEEKAKGTKSSLASQLAEALKETEEARAEARDLKRALEAAKKSSAQTATAKAGRSVEEEVNLVRKAADSKGGGKFTIGELLINAGLVTGEQVDEAIDQQKNDRHQHIGAILVKNGWASEDAVAQALAYQCNVDFVRVSDQGIDAASTALITERLANQHSCIPIASDETSMTLAMVNPLDLVAIEDIERSSSRKVDVVVGTPREIRDAINKYYWEPN